jgi:hypothetical protein
VHHSILVLQAYGSGVTALTQDVTIPHSQPQPLPHLHPILTAIPYNSNMYWYTRRLLYIKLVAMASGLVAVVGLYLICR